MHLTQFICSKILRMMVEQKMCSTPPTISVEIIKNFGTNRLGLVHIERDELFVPFFMCFCILRLTILGFPTKQHNIFCKKRL